MKNYIGISRDHSGSMSSIAKAAARDYNSNIEAIKVASINNNQDTIVSVVKCGAGRPARTVREIVNSSIVTLQPILESAYVTDGNSTPLFDSVGELIDIFESTPDKDDVNVSFLVMTITDGEENSSSKWTGKSLSEKIRQLQATDRWTFVFRVPRGHARTLARMGIPEGNILEWDQTNRGVEVASQATAAAFDNFYKGRTAGVKSTTRFFADVGHLSEADIKSALDDITTEVQLFYIDSHENGMQIRDFCQNHTKTSMIKGTAFYQLTKTEEVQDHKLICIKNKLNGQIYGGTAARDLIGLPHYGTVKVSPGQNGDYVVFVQSTSVNRKLVAGSHLLYWPKVRR